MPLLRMLIMIWLASVIAGISCASVSEDGKEWITPPEATEESLELGVSKQALTGTSKGCSCFRPSEWRDTVIVPDTWSGANCISYCGVRGASRAQAHCFRSTGTKHTYGAAVLLTAATLPPPPPPPPPAQQNPNPNNCGW